VGEGLDAAAESWRKTRDAAALRMALLDLLRLLG
jgi:hypothetical protein